MATTEISTALENGSGEACLTWLSGATTGCVKSLVRREQIYPGTILIIGWLKALGPVTGECTRRLERRTAYTCGFQKRRQEEYGGWYEDASVLRLAVSTLMRRDALLNCMTMEKTEYWGSVS